MEAAVEVDEHQRITKYEANDGSLQLETKRLPPVTTWSKEENDNFLSFLAEKSIQTSVPLPIMHLCKEFAEKNGISRTIRALEQYLYRNLPNILELNDFNLETRVRMMFALSVPVEQIVLNELRKNAVVETDEHNRIIKYEANNGSLKLNGDHSRSAKTKAVQARDKRMSEISEASEIDEEKEDDDELRKLPTSRVPTTVWSKEEKDKLLNFIAEKSKQAKKPLLIKHLSEEFAEKIGISRTMRSVETYIHKNLSPNISKLHDFDIHTRMKMLFALSVSLDQEFLNKLPKEAIVEVDEHQRITKYEANDERFQLEAKRLPPLTVWSKDENDNLLEFIAQKSKQTTIPLNVLSMSKDFAEMNGISRTMRAVLSHIIKHLLPNISKLDEFDTETRMRMLYALSAPVDQEFLNELRKKAFVEVDKKRRITKYEAKDGSLKLKRDRSMSETARDIDEKEIVSGFFYDSEIDEDEEDEQEDVEEVSRPNTRNGRLSKIRFSDNHFSDSDDDAWESSENVKKLRNKKKEKDIRKHAKTYFSESDEENEDEEREEEYEEGESESNSPSTRSGERSEKRHPVNDFSCDFDDLMFDSPENVEDSKLEEEIDEFDGKSMSSSPKVPLVKNQKRKIVENHSDVTSPSRKFSKYGRDADTLNGTESEKITSETNKSDDEEVIYNGIVESLSPVELPIKQEPLSYEEVKLENEEYKPDLSFLCSTTQEAIQNLSETRVNHTENVDQLPRKPLSYKEVKLEAEEYKPNRSLLSSITQKTTKSLSETEGNHVDGIDQPPEITEEVTSGKDFLKLLRGLANTLDTPILVELQSRIENAIEKLGDGDHKILTEEIVMTLNTGLIIWNKSASTINPSTGESTSLRDFLFILRSTLSTLQSSSLSAFQLKIKETIKKLDTEDKIIPIENIRPVLETLFLLAMP